MSMLIIFTLGYLLGGITALLVLGLAVAARRGDRGSAIYTPRMSAEETVAAWRGEGETVPMRVDTPRMRR
jgi:hypothetical protein